MIAGGDADRAGGLFPEFAQGRDLGLDLLQAWANGPEQVLARLRRRDTAGGAGQEPKPEPCLELADGLAQGRLRDPELGGSAGKAPFPRDGQERGEVVQVLARHS